VRFRVRRTGAACCSAPRSATFISSAHRRRHRAAEVDSQGHVEGEQCDRDFLVAHVDGWDAVEADVRGASRGALLSACGVSPADVDTAYGYAPVTETIFAWRWASRSTRTASTTCRPSSTCVEPRHARQAGRGAVCRSAATATSRRRLGRLSPALKTEFARRLQGAYGVRLPRHPG